MIADEALRLSGDPVPREGSAEEDFDHLVVATLTESDPVFSLFAMDGGGEENGPCSLYACRSLPAVTGRGRRVTLWAGAHADSEHVQWVLFAYIPQNAAVR
jgi:hypothetical protein